MVDIHAIISLGRVLRLMATVNSTQSMRSIYGPFDTKYAFNIMDGRHSCDHQSWAGPPPDGHGPLDTKYAFNIMDGPVTIQSSSIGRGLTASVRVPPLCMVLVGYVQLQFPRAEVSAVYRRARRYAPSCAVSGRDYGCVRVGEPSHAVVANVLH